jgi:hypothetical protein
MPDWTDLRKPANVLSLIIGLLGIALAIVFYLAGKQEKTLAYLCPEQAITVYDHDRASGIRVTDRDSIIIDDDVAAVTWVIWNAGDLPIDSTDLRRPVTILPSPCKKLLDYRITFVTDSDIVHPIMVVDAGKLLLRWTHLDPGMQIRGQATFSCEGGAVTGATLSTQLAPPTALVKARNERAPSGAIVWFALTVVGLVMATSARDAFRGWRHRRTGYVLPLLRVAVSLAIMSLMIWEIARPDRLSPPSLFTAW